MNGFYPVLNEIHDKAVKDLPLAECALFEHLWRKLIGWNKFEDDIAISQLVKETSGSRATILRLLKKLEAKRWIIISRSVTDKVHDTNTISIPECPGIKMRLGWCQNDTTPGIDMTLGGGVKMIHTTDSLSTDSLQTEVEPPKKVFPKAGIRDDVNIQKALLDKWGMFSVSDDSVRRLLESVTLFAGSVGQDPETREEVKQEPRYAPLDFWFDMINSMNGKPDHVSAIIKYGKKAWPDYKRRNKLS